MKEYIKIYIAVFVAISVSAIYFGSNIYNSNRDKAPLSNDSSLNILELK